MEITKKLINEVVQKIVATYKPEKIILFGSFANGKPDFNSDLDILIIKHSNLRRDKRAMEIYKLFSDRTFPLDIIVYTPDEVEQYIKLEGSFIKDVFDNGEVLYERAA